MPAVCIGSDLYTHVTSCVHVSVVENSYTSIIMTTHTHTQFPPGGLRVHDVHREQWTSAGGSGGCSGAGRSGSRGCPQWK